MSDQSAIEWTDSTWNVVTGCTRVSPGCAHCYIERTPPFRMTGRQFLKQLGTSGKLEERTGLVFHPERLERVPKGPRVFVNSLSDLFHEDIPDDFIAQVFVAMSVHPDRTFQVLTKRPERALTWFRHVARYQDERLARHSEFEPLPNVWLGVSIENARYTWRADVLREIPAAVRFISAEPLLGSLFDAGRGERGDGATAISGRSPDGGTIEQPLLAERRPLDLTGIDWVIVGGESGPGARPMHPEWARELRDACVREAAGYRDDFRDTAPADLAYRKRPAFFFKQWGEWAPGRGEWSGSSLTGTRRVTRRELLIDRDGRQRSRNELSTFTLPDGWVNIARFGKKKAGRELDGRTWDEFPATREAVAA